MVWPRFFGVQLINPHGSALVLYLIEITWVRVPAFLVTEALDAIEGIAFVPPGFIRRSVASVS
jgi:hypothetical protein